jgi:NADPH2:quinone reductase
MAELTRWAAAGKLSCHVHRAYPLAETAQALKALTDRQVMGKVVVTP